MHVMPKKPEPGLPFPPDDDPLGLGEDDGSETDSGSLRERYQFFMSTDPKMRDILGDIETEFDPIFGRETKFRMMNVGMVRNAKKTTPRKVYLEPLPHTRLDAAKPLQGWYKAKDDDLDGQRPRPCFTDAVLTEPYGGYCAVGCSFCYINSGFRGYRGSGLITVPIGYGDQVAKMLRKMQTAAAGYFSSFTDPFLPLEDVYGNTRAGAEAFTREGLPVFFLSRMRYPGWAYDLLAKNRYSYAQKSLNTGIDADFKKLSPRALSLTEHIAEVAELRKRGIYTSIQVNPIIAGITTHDDIECLFDRLAAVGNNHVIVKFVEAGFSWAPAMVERLRKGFGDRAEAFADLFVDNIGGQRTIAEEYRLDAHRRYRAMATKRGMTYATCYEYKYLRDKDGTIISKVGVSIGREFTTAAQCHGHKVPMFARDALGDFAPIAECAPTGCLYCAEDNGGKPRCGSATLGAAKAMRMSDYAIPLRKETA